MKPLTIAYVACSSKKGRNAEYPIHVLMGVENWPGRVLDMRGLGGRIVARRPADPSEEAGIRSRDRALEYKYRNLRGLIEDEINCGTSVEVLEVILWGFCKQADFEAARQLLDTHKSNLAIAA